MLAPMQGFTNRAMRSIFIDWVRPDIVFTEFIRVHSGTTRQRIAPADLLEAASAEPGIPLIAQLIGHNGDNLAEAAQIITDSGASHINLNMGCPYGRMSSGACGGEMLRNTAGLDQVLKSMRKAIKGSFSIKLRAGHSDPRQIFTLLQLFEDHGVDFLILHPRTVVQKYSGYADHRITSEVIQHTRIPVIANGDISSVTTAELVRQAATPAGLMLGRGAISDPLLFRRIREGATTEPTRAERAEMLRYFLGEALQLYSSMFCGNAQILAKIKNIISGINDPAFEKCFHQLKKTQSPEAFRSVLDTLA